MRISYELDFESFKPWSGAVDTHARIVNAGKAELFESMLEDCYPDGMTETELNDFLWFEPETCYKWVGLRTETEIREEIKEAETELADLEAEFREQLEEIIDAMNEQRGESGERPMSTDEKEVTLQELWENEYSAEAANIHARLEDLRAELEKVLEES